MEDEQTPLTAFQELLTQAYRDYCDSRHNRRVSDNQFARWLGVSPVSFNQWVNGSRRPSFENAVLLSKRLGNVVFDLLGYDRPVAIIYKDKDLLFVTEHWAQLDNDTRRVIVEHITEYVANIRAVSHNQGNSENERDPGKEH